MSTRSSRSHGRSSDRRIWVFSEPNPDLRAEDMARLLAAAALEAAARETDHE